MTKRGFYIAFGITATLMIGGWALYAFKKPKVDLAEVALKREGKITSYEEAAAVLDRYKNVKDFSILSSYPQLVVIAWANAIKEGKDIFTFEGKQYRVSN